MIKKEIKKKKSRNQGEKNENSVKIVKMYLLLDFLFFLQLFQIIGNA